MDVAKLLNAKLNRRQLLGNLGMMGAGAVMTACGGTVVGQIGQDPQQREGANFDAAILNFALNLEYLEAAFYLAVVGRLGELPGFTPDRIQLPDGYTGTDPSTSLYAGRRSRMGAQTVTKVTELVGEFAQELAEDELNHVIFLRAALEGIGAPVADLPVINLNSSFVAAATAADGLAPGGLGFDPNAFNPFANDVFFLHGSFIFEDVGVTAYKGAARFIANGDFLEAAAGILAVEAYHSGTIRSFLYASDQRREFRYGGVDIWKVVQAISDARDALDGPDDLDQGIANDGPNNLPANIVPADENSIAFSRTPLQVAQIVQLNPDAANLEVSFFPQGISVPAGLEGEFAALLDPTFPRNL
jgi:hypothetical protein